MKTSDYIFDELDDKLRDFIDNNGSSPDSIEMDLYTYLDFKNELGYDQDDMKEIKTWQGFKVIVNIFNEERTLRFLQAEKH